MTSVAFPHRPRLGVRELGIALALLAFLTVGFLGVYRYARGYWLYRGFPPPRDPSGVAAGETVKLAVGSPALGGRRQEVEVYLPPGYQTSPSRRYPVFYLLHGFPGRPEGFLLALRAGVLEDVLIARHRIEPMILVMPLGSTGTFTDKEWANGIRPHEGWETFVARDVVHAIDARYRTVATGAGRAIGGLSEGGYGALNIALHHPAEFHVVESWSGYERADDLKSIFGNQRGRLRLNSPLDELPRAAAALRRAGAYFWLYSARDDRFRHQNMRFAGELARAGIRHTFFLVHGGHNFAVWRAETGPALLAAGTHVARP
jgi:enterochelin esterase-like enzyme